MAVQSQGRRYVCVGDIDGLDGEFKGLLTALHCEQSHLEPGSSCRARVSTRRWRRARQVKVVARQVQLKLLPDSSSTTTLTSESGDHQAKRE